MRRFATAIAAALGAIALAAPVAAQGPRLSIATGVSKALTEISQARPAAGVGFEILPQWTFRSGLGLGLGFRYTATPSVPDRRSLFADVRYTGRERGGVAPVVGLRLGAFVGGDDGGDDPYLGLELGPVLGLDVPLSSHVTFQVLASGYGVLAIYRDFRVMPGLQAGLALR